MKNKLSLNQADNLDLRFLILSAYDIYANNLSVDEIVIQVGESGLHLRYEMTYSRENAEDLKIFVSRNIKDIDRVIPERIRSFTKTIHRLNTDIPFKDKIPHPRMETYNPHIIAGEMNINVDDPYVISAIRFLEDIPNYVKEIMIYDNYIMITPSDKELDLSKIDADDWNTYLRPDWIEVYNFYFYNQEV